MKKAKKSSIFEKAKAVVMFVLSKMKILRRI
jgi:hypothetical protein